MEGANMTTKIQDGGREFEVQTQSIVSDIRDVLMSRRRAATYLTPWRNMTEDDQQQEIIAVTNLAEQVVRKVVDVVADRGFETVYATLENVALKDSKATLKIANLDDPDVLVAVGAHIGKSVRLIVADAGEFDQQRNAMEADADQPPLPMDGDDDDSDVDDLYRDALNAVRTEGKCSTSFIQRTLAIGYNKAAALVERMEEEGIVSASNHVGKREILIAGDTEEKTGADEFPETDELDEAPKDANGQPLAPKAEGYHDYMKNNSENPFNDGTEEAAEWQAGYDQAAKEAKQIMDEGAEAFGNGDEPDACAYKKGTEARMFWLRGYDLAEKAANDAELGDSAEDFDNDVDENEDGE
jgi:hypothetical protein